MRFISGEVTRKFGKFVLKSKKNSPHIFFAMGVVGVVGSTVLACKSTLKLDKEIDQIREDVLGVRELASSKKNIEDYKESDYVKDLVYVYGKSSVKVIKMYAAPAIIGTASVALLAGSHVQLTRRNAALTATLTALAKTFDDYRARVREQLGEEKELDIHRAVRTEKIEGSKQVVKVANPYGMSDYARVFDRSNRHYENSIEINRNFLECQQNYLNHQLHSRGYVFLNEAYDQLGFEKTKAGQIVGWVWHSDSGDGYIDFGLFEAHAENFMKGLDPELYLDFNVDGPILDLIEEI